MSGPKINTEPDISTKTHKKKTYDFFCFVLLGLFVAKLLRPEAEARKDVRELMVRA